MKLISILTFITFISISYSAMAKTICSMTFNSADEKQVFKQYLTPHDYNLKELVPANKDPNWFKKACNEIQQCDILVISGHFGGIFFGEQSSSTLSLNELINARDKSFCPAILDKPKSVFLMGCNTLASKLPDHRSVNDYLRVLTGDGFPLNLAEEVAAARYLNFGQSVLETMSSVFNKTELLVGFDSTGPLGAQAAPKLKKAFELSSIKDRNATGISKDAILSAFQGTNLKAIKPQVANVDLIRSNALSLDFEKAKESWLTILKLDNISKYYDFLIKNQNHPTLSKLLTENLKIAANVHSKMREIFFQAAGLSEIQVKILDFLKLHQLIDYYTYEELLLKISSSILMRDLDYISADQLCTLYKTHREIDIFSKLSSNEVTKIDKSIYRDIINECGGKFTQKNNWSNAYQCLINQTTHDWACLTENQLDLDISACVLAKSRNTDPENSDDMLWYCYDRFKKQNNFNQAKCLELTHYFSILGNQIKMNWNCLNKISP